MTRVYLPFKKGGSLLGRISKQQKLYEKTREQIKEDLLSQLQNNKVYGKHFTELVEDYLSFFDVKNELLEDIKERGVKYKYQHGKEQWGYKKNESVSELSKVSAAMLKILSELNLKPSPAEKPQGNGGDNTNEYV